MALPAVIYDDVELWAVGYLRTALAARSEAYTSDLYVSASMPKNAETGEPERRTRMVLVRRDGGGRTNQVLDNPRMSIDCWAATWQDATNLARMVAALIQSAPGDSNVKRAVMTGGPTRVADPSRQPRVYTTFDLVVKGSDLA
jgi:hypothetical protein